MPFFYHLHMLLSERNPLLKLLTLTILPRFLSGGRSLLKMLSLVILDPRGANGSFYINFSFGAIFLNKCQILHNNNTDLEVKVIGYTEHCVVPERHKHHVCLKGQTACHTGVCVQPPLPLRELCTHCRQPITGRLAGQPANHKLTTIR